VKRSAAVIVCAGLAALFGATTGASAAVVGSAGIGDKYFPKLGNGGYDVKHYDVVMTITPATNTVDAEITIRLNARTALKSFDLDFVGPEISSLTLDGEEASFSRHGQELRISPPQNVGVGAHEVTVDYSGTPPTVTDPDGSSEGWVATPDGSAALGEPKGTMAWLPCNNHPTDKATYRFELTVPNSHVAIANGKLVSQVSGVPNSTFTWRQTEPMASYLATVDTGVFNLEQTTYAGIPAWNAVDPTLAADTNLSPMEDILTFESDTFGKYPWAATGAIVDLNSILGYSLETQTRPYYPIPPDDILLTHELAHQWFGDSVSVHRWKNIWLNEGFATFAEWLWTEHNGGDTTKQTFDDYYATPKSEHTFWNPPPARPGSGAKLFDNTVYTRGGMTLEVLRERIGDADFFKLLKTWVKKHSGGDASTEQFIALAVKVSGEDVRGLLHKWLYKRGKPSYHGHKAKAGATPPAPIPTLR
jgi:aminopeptidase N